MKLSVSIPDEQWAQVINCLGLTDHPELVSPSRIVQAALHTWFHSQVIPVKHQPCDCNHCHMIGNSKPTG